MKTSTLRPGLLVSLKTSQRGNVTYTKEDIFRDRPTEDGKREAIWKTQRTIALPAEHDAACKVRTKARSLISSACANSAFGLLCPEDQGDVLEAKIAEAHALVDEFNAAAKMSRVYLCVIAGRIAPDDVEAVKAINSEISDLMEVMRDGIGNLDVKAVRDAANRVRSVGQMLSPDAQARVQLAVDAARAAAKKIVAAGEQAAQEIDRQAIARIAEARTAFLDLDDAGEVGEVAAEQRAIDLDPETDAPKGLIEARTRCVRPAPAC